MLPVRTNRDVLVERLAPQGKTLVDIGCGDGRLARVLREEGAVRVTGIECSPRQLAKAAALPPMDGVEVVEGVAEALPLADGSVDGAVFFNSLHHVPAVQMDTAMAEAARVLKPGGLCVVVEPVAEGPFFQLCRPVDDETEVRRLAQAAIHDAHRHGLRVVAEDHYVHVVKLRDFESFRDRIVSANVERDARFAAMDTELREAFVRLSARDGDAYTFDQPGLTVVLQRDYPRPNNRDSPRKAG